MKLNRSLALCVALLGLAAGAHADLASLFTNTTTSGAAASRRPSIIFLQCHGLAPGDLSCYGQTNYQTPNLDRLAAGGLRFTQYSGGGDSTATTVQLLAGNRFPFRPGEPSLAQRLGQSGYRTGLIGEWMFDREPWRRGFDEFAGFFSDAEAQDYYADYLWRHAPGAILSEDGRQREDFSGKEAIHANTGGQQGKYLPDLLLAAAANFARNNQPDFANRYRPFFLLVNLPAPRTAVTGADEFPVPTDAPFTTERWPQAAKNRAALITRIDSGVGRLLEQLDKLRLTNNIALFFSSSAAPEKFANTNLNFLLPKDSFRSAKNPAPTALPMIVYWPGKVAPGQVSAHEWTSPDFAPTALEIACLQPGTNFTGHSILPVLTARPPGKPPGPKP
jgi:arylsulfatase A-like enzyme